MYKCILDRSPIVYYISGRENSEWVLFIHAAFANHNMFDLQIDYFKDKYNIITIDIIGHGESVNTQKGDSVNKMSQWIDQILKTEKINKIHIVGISLGAVIAQDFANRYSESVKSLACFGGYDINNFDSGLKRKNSAAQSLNMLKAIFSVKWFAKSNKKIAAYTSDAQNAFYEMNILFSKKSFMYLSSLGKMINTCQAKRREYPILIGCGEHDISMEVEAVKMWNKCEPESKMIVFENAGHCVNMDVPDKFNAVMDKFMSNGEL